MNWLESKSYKAALLYGALFALILEAITCLFRFGFGLRSTHDTKWLATLTFGVRIHHGYIGIILLIAAALPVKKHIRKMLLILGIGLVLSDIVHHFIVLWAVTGSPEFDLVYPT